MASNEFGLKELKIMKIIIIIFTCLNDYFLYLNLLILNYILHFYGHHQLSF